MLFVGPSADFNFAMTDSYVAQIEAVVVENGMTVSSQVYLLTIDVLNDITESLTFTGDSDATGSVAEGIVSRVNGLDLRLQDENNDLVSPSAVTWSLVDSASKVYLRLIQTPV